MDAPQRSQIAFGIKTAKSFFYLLALPRIVCYRISCLLLGSRAFLSSSESIARVPGLRGVYLRQAFYQSNLSACGNDVYFGWLSVMSMTEACLADRVYIGRYCSLGFADIGEDVMLADGVQILSGGHEHGDDAGSDESMHDQGQTYQRVRIGAKSWIGAGAIVMADVGENCIIGAGSVVNKPIPANSVAVGVPAKVIKSRKDNHQSKA